MGLFFLLPNRRFLGTRYFWPTAISFLRKTSLLHLGGNKFLANFHPWTRIRVQRLGPGDLYHHHAQHAGAAAAFSVVGEQKTWGELRNRRKVTIVGSLLHLLWTSSILDFPIFRSYERPPVTTFTTFTCSEQLVHLKLSPHLRGFAEG